MSAQSVRRWSFSGDTLLIYSGLTRQFSVDTPSEDGLTSTRIPEGELKEELSARGIPWPVHVREVHTALPPELTIAQTAISVGVPQRIDIHFTAGQRTPSAQVEFTIPPEVRFAPERLSVNIIGRGDCPVGSLGNVAGMEVVPNPEGGHLIRLRGVDLRPSNGTDVILSIHEAVVGSPLTVTFLASYTTTEPEILSSPVVETTLRAVNGVTDLRKVSDPDSPELMLDWNHPAGKGSFSLLTSLDEGKTWRKVRKYEMVDGRIHVKLPDRGKWLAFKLKYRNGESNWVWHYPGQMDVTAAGVPSDGSDCTDPLNRLIADVARRGGGTLYFPQGEYGVRTIHLMSHIWLHLGRGSVIKGLLGFDEPELTWFSDRAYRSGLSPTDVGPYRDPENYLTKQDVGHTFFKNAMFFGERIHDVRITGSGRISGNGNLVTSDKVMNNDPGRRADKMFCFKLCRDIEIGGETDERDMWYDPASDAPVYLAETGADHDCGNMLHVDQAGHFALLATGTDGINVHDTCFGTENTKNVRDIYDFMGCSDVRVRNVYSKVGSDDIVKLGSDCSLGFTRKAKGYLIRNIVGDTNCNLFQIGSETSDDIEDVYVDNIYVLGANKAGFSISTNDGAVIRNVSLNSGRTGPLHSRSVMLRTKTPFFISISNRGRSLGTQVKRVQFVENGILRDELLVMNSSIGRIENIHIGHVDIAEVYAGSSYKKARWAPYDGSQESVTPIFAGYSLPILDASGEEIRYDLPDGRTTGYIEGLYLEDIHLTVKGGHPESDGMRVPPELGVGKYNVKDFGTLPAYGLWFRHVKDLHIDDCSVSVEEHDGRRPVILDDVIGTDINQLIIYPTKN